MRFTFKGQHGPGTSNNERTEHAAPSLVNIQDGSMAGSCPCEGAAVVLARGHWKHGNKDIPKE